jgi:hypothetical protein
MQSVQELHIAVHKKQQQQQKKTTTKNKQIKHICAKEIQTKRSHFQLSAVHKKEQPQKINKF